MTAGGSTLIVGTRGSALALWQTERVRALLLTSGYLTTRVEIKTTGDVILDVPLADIGSKALFTRQLDDALLDGRIDLAIHSLKDLPTELPPGIVLAAVGAREDPRDALVGRGPLRWADVPHGAVVATSSLRRRAQLLHARPDLQVVDIRGNVDTRLRKLDQNAGWTATVLATAGLVRLGHESRIGERMSLEVMLPAPGQGALAATVRAGDMPALAACRAALHDESTGACVSAERAFLGRLEGGCQVPVAAHARLEGRVLRVQGRVISLDGRRIAEGERVGPAATADAGAELGRALAEDLLRHGAGEILAEVRSVRPPTGRTTA